MISPFSQWAFSQGIPWATVAPLSSLLLGWDNWPGQKRELTFLSQGVQSAPLPRRSQVGTPISRSLAVGCQSWCPLPFSPTPTTRKGPCCSGPGHICSLLQICPTRAHSSLNKKPPIGSERIELITISVTKPPRPPPPY